MSKNVHRARHGARLGCFLALLVACAACDGTNNNPSGAVSENNGASSGPGYLSGTSNCSREFITDYTRFQNEDDQLSQVPSFSNDSTTEQLKDISKQIESIKSDRLAFDSKYGVVRCNLTDPDGSVVRNKDGTPWVLAHIPDPGEDTRREEQALGQIDAILQSRQDCANDRSSSCSDSGHSGTPEAPTGSSFADSSHAAGQKPVYPPGFSKTGIQFPSSVISKIEEQSKWYCATIQFIEKNRLDGLSAQVKSSLVKPLRFGDLNCKDNLQFAGLVPIADKNENAYVEFVTIEYALTFLKQATAALPETDDLSGGIKILDQGILDLRINWINAQTGYDPNNSPHVVDQMKHDWTSAIDGWTRASYSYYTM